MRHQRRLPLCRAGGGRTCTRVLAAPAPACVPADPGRFRPGCVFFPPLATEAAGSSSSLGRPATAAKAARCPQDSLGPPAAGSGGVGMCGKAPAWQSPQSGGGSFPQGRASPASVAASRPAGCRDARPGQRLWRRRLPLQEVHVRQRPCAPPSPPSLLDALPRSPPGAINLRPPPDSAGSGAGAVHGLTARVCADAQQPLPASCGSRQAIPITALRQCR